MAAANTRRALHPSNVGGIVFLIAVVLSGLLVWQITRQSFEREQANVARLTGDHAHMLEHTVEHALSATHALAAMLHQGKGVIPDFESTASAMLPFYPGASALALAPGGIVRDMVPMSGNEKAIGLDLFNMPALRKESVLARDSGKLTLAGPLELAMGGTGVVGRLPVFLEDGNGQAYFWGFAIVVIRLPEGLDIKHMSPLGERGLGYELWRTHPDTGQKQIIARSGPAALIQPMEHTLHVPNATWVLSVAPLEGWRHPLELAYQVALALLFSLLLGYLAKLLAESRTYKQQLEVRVAERTAEIERAEQALRDSRESLRHLLDSMAEGAYGVDLDGNCTFVNRAFLRILGYQNEAEVLGRRIHALIHHSHADGSPYPASDCRMYLAYRANRAINVTDEVFWRKDGVAVPVEYWSRPIVTDGVVVGAIATFIDITERKRTEASIERMAHFDPLTGLPNRALLSDRIGHDLSTAQRNGTPLALMFVDLDHFKNINDTLGHRIGDELLIAVATRLRASVREVDTVSRQGGDEFILILPNTDADGAMRVAEKLLVIVAQPYQIGNFELTVTLSIGIALYPGDGRDFEALSKCADAAMYRAKRDGRNNYRFFTAEMQARSAHNLQMENDLRRALERDQLLLHYQPQISLRDGGIIGVEALLRWRHPELGMVAPADFIPIAEESGQILQIGEWVLRSAAQQMKTWMDSGLAPQVMAVNLSAVQFRHPHLPELVARILDEVGLAPRYLELELTESVAMDDAPAAIAIMNRLHECGIRMSIDDFGTGYSSLNYLKRFKVNRLKVDQSFVRDIGEDPDDRAIVGAIISLANSLGMQTIAEGVETEGQLAFLREQGCNEVQGYYFSKPLPAEEFEAFVTAEYSSAWRER